ncbi:16S rRNA (uracil(1498)-N(3))-methyltransferase [Leptolyngbya sp. NIES-2104]|uniref:16S rRNA (uracil(1498)-N(3))-methyltransferase n=1 Tax=Leptolyngbya sp. NIES-2104 TaxID=1552121 RepID=UPI0006ECBE5E|nr:16S rRNA (uracil(1498)-N(3))-methyltransferase [Leptolyngbya sp. NIES-2104]GAP96743.1 ribosomal RNA small subunit methyltransferase E [Leptolyngbya sp. NIES-2104]
MSQLQRLVIAESQGQGSIVSLSSEQQHYLQRVLRLKKGDRFIALDGKGQTWIAILESDQATLIESLQASSELSVSITLMLALPKTGFDDVVRQVTELGVACIAPVMSDRTLLNPSGNKLDRWRRIVQEAAEQSERQIVPTILEPMPFKVALEELKADSHYICAERSSSQHLLNCEFGNSVIVAIGPEGGWTTGEIESAIAHHYQPVTLGKRILRAVTAPIAAISLIAGLVESRAESET